MRGIYPTCFVLFLTLPLRGAENPAQFFEAKVRPLLLRRCVNCHGPDKAHSKLRLDSRAAILGGGKRGPTVVPGKPAASLLLKAIRYSQGAPKMPPSGKLKQHEIQILTRWIQLGAPWPKRQRVAKPARDHWAFRPVRRVTPPTAKIKSHNPIDAFVAARHRQQGLSANRPAPPAQLVRRLYFDVIGLPPPWPVVKHFSANPSPAAYRNLVNQLLQSPRYGERWGRHWLDLVRYSDTQGGSVDCPIPAARLYRDYVIDAFSQDKPYDQFVREQIAGDILARQSADQPQRFREQIIASGFVGLSLRNGIFKHYHPELIIEDTIDTIGRAMLGLSIRCARCHDHKFEPISTADYYRLYGIFDSSRYPFTGSELPTFSAGESVLLISQTQFLKLPKTQRQRIEQLRRTIKKTRDRQAKDHDELKTKYARFARDSKHYRAIRRRGDMDVALRTSLDDQDVRIREVIARLDNSVRPLWNELKRVEQAAGIERAYAMREATPRDARIQVYGDPFDTTEFVRRGIPKIIAGKKPFKIPPGQSGRLQLASWIADRQNPLTARVAVNYIWQFHFGRGIVDPPDNFGVSGNPPTHPALLDWLAAEFVANGWSMKHIHRLILTSRTYQMSSVSQSTAATQDPENRWLWRFPPRRLDAESIRDGMMAISGTLNLTRPGAHPFPPEPTWQFSQHGPFKAVYHSSHRTVYLMTQRIQRHPFMALFDGPDTNRPTPRRKQTAAALQALYLRNSAFVHKQAEAWAKHLLTLPASHRAATAIRHAWSRQATPQEIAAAANYVRRYSRQAVAQRKRQDKAELVLEYRFDGNARDTSGNNHHGKVVGNPRFVPGHRGQCISFDGSGDYIDSLRTLNDLGQRFAIECWVRPAKTQHVYADIFGNHLGGGRGFVVQQAGRQTNQFTASIGTGNNTWQLTQPAKLQPGRWQKFAMVRTPNTLALYLNGKPAVQRTTQGKIHPSPLTFRVGLGITIVQRVFQGEIDDLRVYRGLTPEYKGTIQRPSGEFAAWASYCRILLTANEFLYVD